MTKTITLLALPVRESAPNPITDQPAPMANTLPAVWDLVTAEIRNKRARVIDTHAMEAAPA